jgi:hypothetical protein
LQPDSLNRTLIAGKRAAFAVATLELTEYIVTV